MKKVLPSAVACSWNCSTMPSGDVLGSPVMDPGATRKRPGNLPQITLRVKVQHHMHGGGRVSLFFFFFFFAYVKRSKTGRWEPG